MTSASTTTRIAEVAQVPEDFEMIRTEVRRLCDRYGNEYWRGLEPDRYPEEFVKELTTQGWLGSLIPEEYGGGGLSLAGASVILEEIAASGGNPAVCHAQMYVMGTLLRHGLCRTEAPLPPADRGWPQAATGLRCHRTHRRFRHLRDTHQSRTPRRHLADKRPENMDVQGAVFGPDDPFGPYHACQRS